MKDILQQLQSRIDKKGYSISQSSLYSDWNHPIMKKAKKEIMAEQALDKRLLGEIVRMRRAINSLGKEYVWFKGGS
jgi:hypothetical protein